MSPARFPCAKMLSEMMKKSLLVFMVDPLSLSHWGAARVVSIVFTLHFQGLTA